MSSQLFVVVFPQDCWNSIKDLILHGGNRGDNVFLCGFFFILGFLLIVLWAIKITMGFGAEFDQIFGDLMLWSETPVGDRQGALIATCQNINVGSVFDQVFYNVEVPSANRLVYLILMMTTMMIQLLLGSEQKIENEICREQEQNKW